MASRTCVKPERGHVGRASSNLCLLKDAIKDDAETATLRCHLEKCGSGEVEEWRDEHGYDLMHYAICANSQEAVLLLFMKGYFRSPYQPFVPYLHLSCELGLRTVTGIILDYRTSEDSPMFFHHGELPVTVKPCCPKSNVQFRNLENGASVNDHKLVPKLTPLDVAARQGHLNCVRFLLDRYDREICSNSARKISMDHLSLATTKGSSAAVELLLNAEKFSKQAILTAVDYAIREIQPTCLDFLLSQEVETRSLYSGMNLYHVLYKYPLSFNQERLFCYSKATSVLIKHGFDVNAKIPSRTYPLYSLLSCESLYLPAAQSYQVKCLKSLLCAGADPNYDEAVCENREGGGAYGREAYPSALFCLFHTVYSIGKTHPETVESVNETVLKDVQLLLQHGADVRKVASVYHLFGDGQQSDMTVLHEYIRCSTVLGVDDRILKLLLRSGASPTAKFKGMPPFTLYCVGRHSLAREKTENPTLLLSNTVFSSIKVLLKICHYLPFGYLNQYRRNLQKILPNEDVTVEFVEELSCCLTAVRSLKHECMTVVWVNCSFRKESVDHLPLPRDLKMLIKAMG